MTFDTSPVVLNRINDSLRQDPMVIRWMLMKKGSAM
jgi:small subunit ribosomal protein S6